MVGLYSFGAAMGQRYGGRFLLQTYLAAALAGSFGQIAYAQWCINRRQATRHPHMQRPVLIGTQP
jgi:membrane associated rhomboid family serine protease